MTRYEQILSKITPTFYKLEQYYDYYLSQTSLLNHSYLRSAGVPEEQPVYLYPENIKYFYIAGISNFLPPVRKKEYDIIISLTTKDRISAIHNYVSPGVLIVNMVINKFSFEDRYISSMYSSFRVDFKTLFIALVGKDMYETIRSNIK